MSSRRLWFSSNMNVVLSGVFCELRQYLTLSRFTNTVSSFGAGILMKLAIDRSFYLRVRPRTIAVLNVGLRCHDRGRRRDGTCAAARLVGETFGVSNEPIWVRPVAAALMATLVKAANAPQSMLTRTPSALAQTRNIEAATRPRFLSLASSIESNTAALDFGKCGSRNDRTKAAASSCARSTTPPFSQLL